MKATRLLFIIAIIAMIIGVTACKGEGNSNTSSEDSTKVDTLWNDQVQDIFFDTPFGASREEVISNFRMHGFTLSDISTENRLSFDYKSKYYSFGGMSWEQLDVNLINGRFYSICFYNPRKDKTAALSDYEGIANILSKKYKLTDYDSGDTTVFFNKRAYGKNSCRASASCFRYEAINNEVFYASQLSYTDEDIEKEEVAVSDEL